jgi:hypothetical protein
MEVSFGQGKEKKEKVGLNAVLNRTGQVEKE